MRVESTRIELLLRRWLRPLLWVLAFMPLVLMLTRGVMGDLGANPIERLEGDTGRWTLRFLAGTLAVSPLIALTRWGWMIRERRFLGLLAFSYAALHLSIYVGLDNFFNVGDIVRDVLKHLYVTVGMAAFLLLIPLAITSRAGWTRRLGAVRWKRLHKLVYLVALLGCIHFLWAVKKDKSEPLVYAAIFVTLLGTRLVDIRRVSRAASRRAEPQAERR